MMKHGRKESRRIDENGEPAGPLHAPHIGAGLEERHGALPEARLEISAMLRRLRLHRQHGVTSVVAFDPHETLDSCCSSSCQTAVG